MIAAIVLAAGRSTRMRSGHKLLASLGADTVIGLTVARVAASGVGEVIVVLGHDGERVRSAIRSPRVRFVTAPDFAAGMAASLRAGLAALSPEAAGALVCLGDMPLVRPATIDALLARFHPDAIVAPVHGGRRGNPVLWARAHFASLATLRGDAGGRALLTAPILVETDDHGTIFDIDTDEALAEARKEAGALPADPLRAPVSPGTSACGPASDG